MAGLRLACPGESAMYRTKDDVANFRIKVTLKKRAAFIASQKQLEQEGHNDIELQTLIHHQVDDVDTEERVFTWQEKSFSKREFDFYQLQENCRTSLEKKYHEDIIKLKRKGKIPKRLFCYVDADDFIRRNEITKPITTSVENSNKSVLKEISNEQQRKGIKREPETKPKTSICRSFSMRNGNRFQHTVNDFSQTMVLMADINELDRLGTDQVQEIVLSVIQITSTGILTMTPDFTNGRQPYSFSLGDHNHTVFEYTVEHASLPMSESDKQKEQEILKRTISRQTEIIKNTVGTEFEMPPPDVLKSFLFGEIVSASDFEATNLYVNYLLYLPTNWSAADESQQVYGTTHTCSSNNNGVSHFNFPFSFELMLQNQAINTDEFSWPRIFLEIWSQDFWNRYRIEGYGYINLPFSPGKYEFDIDTWRPVSTNLKSRLHGFFLGYGSELEGIVFTAAPVTSSKLSKQAVSNLGLWTEGSGKLKVRMNIIHQSLDYICKTNGMKSLKNLLQKLRPEMAGQANILTALDAFQRARQQMLAAREKIQSTGELITDKLNGLNLDAKSSSTHSSQRYTETQTKKSISSLGVLERTEKLQMQTEPSLDSSETKNLKRIKKIKEKKGLENYQNDSLSAILSEASDTTRKESRGSSLHTDLSIISQEEKDSSKESSLWNERNLASISEPSFPSKITEKMQSSSQLGLEVEKEKIKKSKHPEKRKQKGKRKEALTIKEQEMIPDLLQTPHSTMTDASLHADETKTSEEVLPDIHYMPSRVRRRKKKVKNISDFEDKQSEELYEADKDFEIISNGRTFSSVPNIPKEHPETEFALASLSFTSGILPIHKEKYSRISSTDNARQVLDKKKGVTEIDVEKSSLESHSITESPKTPSQSSRLASSFRTGLILKEMSADEPLNGSDQSVSKSNKAKVKYHASSYNNGDGQQSEQDVVSEGLDSISSSLGEEEMTVWYGSRSGDQLFHERTSSSPKASSSDGNDEKEVTRDVLK